MQMHRFVGWLLLYSAQSALLFSPSLCTSNTSSSPRDSRKEQQACGDAGLIWESVADSAGNFWGSTGQKKRTVFSFLTNFFPFFFFFFPKMGVGGMCILGPNTCLWQTLEQRVCLQCLAQKVSHWQPKNKRAHLVSLLRDRCQTGKEKSQQTPAVPGGLD